MKQILKKLAVVLIILALVMPLVLPAINAAAQETIQVTDQAVDYVFRDHLTFTLEAASTADISKVDMYYRIVGRHVALVCYLSSTESSSRSPSQPCICRFHLSDHISWNPRVHSPCYTSILQ